jgi:hypothetical protein
MKTSDLMIFGGSAGEPPVDELQGRKTGLVARGAVLSPLACHALLVLPGILAIIGGFVETRRPSGEMDEWFKSHAWKACIGS